VKSRLIDRVVPITTSQTESRIRGYIAAGDIELSRDNIESIDKEGKKSQLSIITRPSTWTPAMIARFLGFVLMTIVLIKVFEGSRRL
jgi:diketogulonate reductase-like aldo/keto reductase